LFPLNLTSEPEAEIVNFCSLFGRQELVVHRAVSMLKTQSTTEEEKCTSLLSLDCLKAMKGPFFSFSVLVGNPKHLVSLAPAVHKHLGFSQKAAEPWLSVPRFAPPVAA